MIDLLLHNLRTIGTHHCDGTVGEEAADEIERLRAEVAGLQIKADLFDLAVRKGLLSVHSELIDPRNHGTRCSWLVGHAKACDISNNAALAAAAIIVRSLEVKHG